MTQDAADAEFDVLAGWTAEVARDLGPDYYEAAGCRGSGDPSWLEWFADRLDLRPGQPVLDVGAGVGGPAAWLARTRRARPVLSETEPRACEAARELFGLPVLRADALRLPVRTRSVSAAWSLGVLCTNSDRADQRRLLRELARVLTPRGRVGVLVLVARKEPVTEPPEGNNFPSDEALERLVAEAELDLVDSADAASLPAAPADWQQRTDAVEAELERRFGTQRAWRVIAEQNRRMTALLHSGSVATRLLVLANDSASQG